MKKIEKKAYAKINLSLDVLKKREDNYHDLSMIMQKIELHDKLIIEETLDKKIVIFSNNKNIPLDSKNIVYKISYTIIKKFKIEKGLKIYIEKNIPIASGLAGGSTDAATTLKILNEMWNLNLSINEMVDISKNIGADIPFFFYDNTALAEGIGEKITPLTSFTDRYILLVNPGISIDTGFVYSKLELNSKLFHPDNGKLINYIKNGDTLGLAENMINVLESVTAKKFPVIEEIKKELKDKNALGSMMSGSGATVFGIFDNERDLKIAAEYMRKRYETVIVTKTI